MIETVKPILFPYISVLQMSLMENLITHDSDCLIDPHPLHLRTTTAFDSSCHQFDHNTLTIYTEKSCFNTNSVGTTRGYEYEAVLRTRGPS